MNSIKTVTAGLAATLASRSFAHEGDHAAGLGNNLWHVLTEPDHRVVLLLAGAVVAAALAVRRSRSRARARRNAPL